MIDVYDYHKHTPETKNADNNESAHVSCQSQRTADVQYFTEQSTNNDSIVEVVHKFLADLDEISSLNARKGGCSLRISLLKIK